MVTHEESQPSNVPNFVDEDQPLDYTNRGGNNNLLQSGTGKYGPNQPSSLRLHGMLETEMWRPSNDATKIPWSRRRVPYIKCRNTHATAAAQAEADSSMFLRIRDIIFSLNCSHRWLFTHLEELGVNVQRQDPRDRLIYSTIYDPLITTDDTLYTLLSWECNDERFDCMVLLADFLYKIIPVS